MKKALQAIGIFAMALIAVSCDKDDDPKKAQVMVVHASPDAPPVDVRVNNSVVLTNVPFPANSAYLPVNAGNTNFKISPTGTTTYVIDATVPLSGDMNYSVFAIDEVSKIKPAVVVDDLRTPASGKSHIRFFHLSPDAPAVDIAVAGGPVVFSNRTFNDQANSPAKQAFTPVNAGTYNLEVRLAGTNTVVLPLPNVTLTAGKIYTVWAKGFVSGKAGQPLGAQIIVNK